MHIPDGFLSAPVWAGLGAVAAPAVVALARRAQHRVDESRLPMIGVMGAFVFAAQMINFPVGLGASGHLVGSGLLTILLGPAPAAVAMAAILVIQALVFQDGGLLALGANVFNMALAGVGVAWLAYRAASARVRRLGFFAAGFLSVLVCAMLCLAELALSGVGMPPQALGLAMVVFTVTAALEGLITLTVVESLERMNPNWLQGPAEKQRPALAALAAAAVLLASAGVLAASALPDGLERLAGLIGLDGKEQVLLKSPMPDYEVLAIEHPWMSKAAAGLSGFGLTWLACLALGRMMTRGRSA